MVAYCDQDCNDHGLEETIGDHPNNSHVYPEFSVFHLPPLLSIPSYEWKPLQVIAGKAKKDELQDVLTMVRNVSNPQVSELIQIARVSGDGSISINRTIPYRREFPEPREALVFKLNLPPPFPSILLSHLSQVLRGS